ncbi:hypothetical protein GBF38_005796 [Nibea albiflora]|uniref:Uncharacterized protein n=1 Tax=Nibea albiflora TaxID=240163 RepID=A0ACB7FAU4_NIBAL|nr:hypothetical protein GBF38_005796 [Nibea albiflora]
MTNDPSSERAAKRQQLVNFDSLRQRVKSLLTAHWEIQKQLQEAKRLKQEEHYEKWMAGHGLSIPQSSLDQPKKRMSKRDKRFLKVKEYFSHRFI